MGKSLRSIAKEVGVHPTTVTDWMDRYPDLPWRDEDGEIDLVHLAEFAESRRKPNGARMTKDQRDWQAEYHKWRAVKARLVAKKMAGELVEVRRATEWYEQISARVSNAFQDMPAQIASMLAHRDADEIQEILEERVREVIANWESDIAQSEVNLQEAEDDEPDSDLG